MGDPNFPPNLDIRPLHIGDNVHGRGDTWQQDEAIQRYGIAGRVWEATELMIQYLTPASNTAIAFDPPCPVFEDDRSKQIIELGSGQSVASLHLASFLTTNDTLVLTDLEEVMPLCDQSVASKRADLAGQVKTAPLAWGSSASHLEMYKPFTHILMCDLIYFPELYAPLLHTLLDLTETKPVPETETFGPEIIMAYKPRTLALEHSFFDAFNLYFRMTPVVGGTSEVRLYLCQRWRVTDEWRVPGVDAVMRGAPGVMRGRDFGYIDQMFASMEW